MGLIGYKIIKPDWKSKHNDIKYEIGKTYELDNNHELEKSGFHFCNDPLDCFKNHKFSPDNIVVEIEASGEIIEKDHVFVTNKIQILNQLSWHQVLDLVNAGKYNTGFDNKGDYNTGSFNSSNNNTGNYNSGASNTGDSNSGTYNTGHSNEGNFNTGNYNIGHYNTSSNNSGNNNTNEWNTGSWNSGRANSGDHNTGWYNSGNFNSGFRNSGNRNSGVFNSCDNTAGVFCSEEQTIYMFNKPTNIKLSEFYESEAFKLLTKMGFLLTASEFVTAIEITEGMDDADNSEGRVIYLNPMDYKEACKLWWENLDDKEKQIVKTLPNFDADIFYEITGIKE
ncbi:MAG: hypothetical protein AB1782_06120 [Cyanobacteriota bacterium]